MAAFTLTASVNIDAIAGKAGGDTYTTAGFTLTIDQDSRVGLNSVPSGSLGTITISPDKGGSVNIDGSSIWMIPYTGATGNVPAWNTTVTQAGQSGTGKLIAVHAALVSASVATGAAFPASGYLRIKQKSGTFASGPLSGVAVTGSDAGRVGWIEIAGDDASTVTANRLGSFNVTGEWYEVGTTNGTSNQTMQIPNNGLLRYVNGVFIEKTSGSADFEFYPNAGVTTTTGTEATRGKVVWISNTGLVRIGNSGAATNGYTPVTGLRVVVGNVFFECCTTAARQANVIPSSTIATRYDFTTTGGGVINISKCNMNWYLSCTQAYSVTLANSGFTDAILLSEVASPMTFTKVGVGNKATTDLLTPALTMTYCFAGGTFTDCVWSRVSHATSAQYTVTFTDITGFTFVRNTFRANVIPANATTYSIFGTRVKSCTWTTPTIIQGQANLVTCDGLTFTDTIYCSAVSGTTVTTYVRYVWELLSNTINCVFSGLTFPVTNTHPYTAVLSITTGCASIKLRSIGTWAAPLDFGTVNACGLIYVIPAAGACFDIKVQRVYVKNTRTGIMTADNSSKGIIEESVFGDYADAVDVMAVINMQRKGMGGTGALTAQTSVYGTHWMDQFTTGSTGKINILMNEPSTETSTYVSTSGGAGFTSQGSLYMPTSGTMSTVFEMPYYCIGHTAFSASQLTTFSASLSGTFGYQYQIDKNNGLGFSSWSQEKTFATVATSLAGETINPQLGFKLKLKVITKINNVIPLHSITLATVATTASQQYQYPLDIITHTVTGLVTGSRVVWIRVSDDALLANVLESGGNASYEYSYTADTLVDVQILSQGYKNKIVRVTLGSTNASLPASQASDPFYSNPV